jgi:glutathionyl-hydroquinone reductase
MDRATRAAKLAEIWTQLCWLEGELESSGGPFLTGTALTDADMTWHPTCVYMVSSVTT